VDKPINGAKGRIFLLQQPKVVWSNRKSTPPTIDNENFFRVEAQRIVDLPNAVEADADHLLGELRVVCLPFIERVEFLQHTQVELTICRFSQSSII
jgi:hypothetical protein